ncbi:MAG: hypothetical protein U9N87_04350 [Planctomycetota bacterium]|nr:hypothetical protein [Planctomycetota bacterium]
MAKAVIPQQSWANGETDGISGLGPVMRGRVDQIEVKISDPTNTITFTLTLTSPDGAELFTKASIARNATTVLKATSDATDYDAFYVDGKLAWTITPSGDPGTSGVTVDVALYGESG